MERVPVAQASNGQPFVDPNAINEEFTMDAVKPVNAVEATLWTTQTVTTTDISIIMSTSVTITTSVAISTSYINAVETSIVMETQTAKPQVNSTLTTSFFSSATGDLIPQTTMDGLSSASPNNGSTTLGMAMSSGLNLPTPAPSLGAFPQASMTPIHTSDTLPKLMGGMVAGIFMLAGVLAGGLFIFRRRKQRISEQEEAANVQRQQQPLMTLPIVPYSSAYGSDLHN